MLNHNMLRMALSIVLASVLAIVLTISWWLSRSESDQDQKIPANEQTIDNETGGLQPLVGESIIVETDGQPFLEQSTREQSTREQSQLDEDVAEFKYRNLKRLMSIRIDTLDEYQLDMVSQQIIRQLPEMVRMGLMHPFDATFAHTQTMSKQAHKLQTFEVEAIQQNYMDLYPFPISSSQLDLH